MATLLCSQNLDPLSDEDLAALDNAAVDYHRKQVFYSVFSKLAILALLVVGTVNLMGHL